jgi:hypothetical protein
MDPVIDVEYALERKYQKLLNAEQLKLTRKDERLTHWKTEFYNSMNTWMKMDEPSSDWFFTLPENQQFSDITDDIVKEIRTLLDELVPKLARGKRKVKHEYTMKSDTYVWFTFTVE